MSDSLGALHFRFSDLNFFTSLYLHMHATSAAHLVVLDLFTEIIFREKYEL